jgi:multiple sugar transport system substrate-binding protein
MKKPTVFLSLALALCLAFVSACGGAAATPAPSAPPASTPAAGSTGTAGGAGAKGATISFWNGFTASDGDILREIFDRFNTENTLGIRVEMDIMPWGNMLEKLAPAIATQTAPALILLGSDTIPEYAASGGLISLEDFWAWSGLDQGNYAQNVQEAFQYNGKTYGIPMQYNTNYLYWNKTLFRAAGLDPEKPPATFSELKDYAAKLTDPAKQQYGFGIATGNVNITNFLWSNGADWLTEDQSRAVCNSPKAIEVLAMLQGFATAGQTPLGMTGADCDNLMTSGQLGLYINGPWLMNGLRTNEVEFGIGAIPAADDGNLQVPGGGVAFMVTSSANEAQRLAAYECMKYWLSKDVLKEWSMRNGIPAWSQEVIADPEIKADPIQNILGPLSQYGRMPFAFMPQLGQISADCLDPLFDQLMYGTLTPEACAKQMEDGLNAILGV